LLTALFPEAKWGFLLTGLIGSSQPHPYAAVPAVTVSCKLVARAPSSTFPSRRSINAHKSNANAVQGRPNTAAHSSSCLAAEPTACQPSSGMAHGVAYLTHNLNTTACSHRATQAHNSKQLNMQLIIRCTEACSTTQVCCSLRHLSITQQSVSRWGSSRHKYVRTIKTPPHNL
jgi:hypothetical protein